MKYLLLILGFVGVVTIANAQSNTISQSVEDLLESVGENMSDDSDIQEILDDWADLQKTPLNINSASKDDFQRLHLLSEVQINNLIAYRSKTGPIYSLYELVAVSGLNQEIVQKIEPFLSFEVVREQQVVKKPTTDIISRTNRTFSNSDQFNQSKYEGSLQRFFVRAKHVSSKFEYGFVAEKDPGEAFLRKSNPNGFDYNSAFIHWKINPNSQLFLGDYTVRFGQGLVAWQGFSMGKSAETTQIFRSAPGIHTYSSTDENLFYRGAATQIRLQNFTFSPFISYHKVDASIDTINGSGYFGALQTTGYHRTESEIENEKSLSQFTSGTHLRFDNGNFSVGGTVVFNSFNASMDRSDEPYNQFLPEGRNSLVGGIDWKGSIKKIFIFGEGAMSGNQGRALISGILINPAPNAELSVVYRNINKTYFSYFANAFTESSRVNDEHALYLGFKLYPFPKLVVQAYADFFKFNWLKYTTAAPSNGTEFFAQATYNISRKTNFYLRLFQEEKGQRLIDGVKRYNVSQLIDRVRLNFVHNLNDRLSFKSRAEFSFYSKQGNEQGFLIFQDVIWHSFNQTYSFNGRLAFFTTSSYNSRIYAYENDLLYSFAVPALYNKGIRAYLNFQKDIGSRISFWLKSALTYELSGNEVDNSSGALVKTELKLQIRYHF